MIRKTHSKLWLYFSGIVFAAVLNGFLFITALWLFLSGQDIIKINFHAKHLPVLFFLVGSILLGLMLQLFVGKLIIKPVQNISNAFDELSVGNFSVRVPENNKLAEIREMAQHFNSMASALSHVETLSNDFVVNVSHEFKTPISAIEGYAVLLQKSSLPEEKRIYYIDKILDNSRRLSTLSSNILELSKLENQEIVMNCREYRLDEQLRKAVLLLENKWSDKNIEFDIDLPKIIFYGSEQLLDRVWINILDNAIKYSYENGVIKIRMYRDEEYIHIEITDYGEGMMAEIQEHIFEKFYQGDTSRKAEGNGLGLALVKRITELCRGSVSVESLVGKGTSFIVSLPSGH